MMQPGHTLRESLTGVNAWLAQWLSGLWQSRDPMVKWLGKENVCTSGGQEEEKGRQEGARAKYTLQGHFHLAL